MRVELEASRARWIEPTDPDRTAVADLRRALDLPEALCRVLVRRGHGTEDEARTFLRPRLTDLHDSSTLPDMQVAVERIERAILNRETLLVHGDYDADGISAAALLTRGLRRLNADVHPFIPHRTDDGYDLSDAGLDRARELGATLIVTVDCGVTAIEAIQKAAGLGIEVIVTDHHRPGPALPPAVAVVNPMRTDHDVPFRGLAGVGVAFKLLDALYGRVGFPETELNQHLDLVAIGTVADQVPLVGENRVLVRAGLRALEKTIKPGVRSLLKRAGVDVGGDLDTQDISFRMAPRLNSVGRMGSAESGLELLLTDQPLEAERLAATLELQNGERRKTDGHVYEEVEAVLRDSFDPDRDRAIIVAGEGWHPGVIGIIASRVAENYHRPAIVISTDGPVGKGSGRSVGDFHLYDALEECTHLLERFGGHRMAAGLTIRTDRIEAFRRTFAEVASRELVDSTGTDVLDIDLGVQVSETRELHRTLRFVGPFGTGNPVPLLMARGVGFRKTRRVGPDGDHLRLVLVGTDGAELSGIGFRLGRRLSEARADGAFDVVFELGERTWKGRTELQARLRDFRPAI